MDNLSPKLRENPLFAVLWAVLIICLAASLILWARNLYKQNYYIGKSTDIQRTISISGDGKVTAIPDIANVTLGLSTEKKLVSDAQTENTRIMNSLIDKLKKLGIDAKDIQTSNYSIYPNYDYSSTGKQTLRSYTVTQNVDVKIRATDKVDDVLKIAGELNLNQVGGLTFSIDNPETYKQQARILALQNAKTKADELAKIMGVKLGKVISFSEYDNSAQPYASYDKGMGLGGGGVAAVPAPAVEAGSQEVSITATVSYELD